MSRDQEWWKARLPLIKAFVEGEKIQVRSKIGWLALGDPSFMDDPKNYRIAPKKKTGWVNIYQDGLRCGTIHKTRKAADDDAAVARIACIQITYKEGDGL